MSAARAPQKRADESREEYLSDAQVAQLVPGITVRTLRDWRHLGGGPVYSNPTGRLVVYLRTDVDAWLRGHRFERTDRPVAA